MGRFSDRREREQLFFERSKKYNFSHLPRFFIASPSLGLFSIEKRAWYKVCLFQPVKNEKKEKRKKKTTFPTG